MAAIDRQTEVLKSGALLKKRFNVLSNWMHLVKDVDQKLMMKGYSKGVSTLITDKKFALRQISGVQKF